MIFTISEAPSWGFLPPIDPLISGIVVLALLALCVRDLRRGVTAAAVARLALRVASGACLGVILAGPGRWIVPDSPGKPGLSILIDRSRSMGVADAGTGRTRLETMKRGWLTAQAVERLAAASELSLIAVDEHAEAIPHADAAMLAPEGGRSLLVSALSGVVGRSRLSGRPSPTHALLLSDAVDTEGLALASLAEDARTAAVRVHAVLPVGAPGPGTPYIEADFDRAWVRAGESAALQVDLSGCGLVGVRARLVIRESGPDGPVIAERLVTLGARQRIGVGITPRVEVPPGDVALARYFMRLDSLPSGRGSDSESAASIQVVGRRLRVVIFENEPCWDTRFFSDALAAEPDIEVTTVYSLDGPSRGEGVLPVAAQRFRVTQIVPGVDSITRTVGAPPPTTPESLEPFDLVVLGRHVGSMLPVDTLAHLRVLIEDRGRAALFLRGPDESEPLAWASPFAGGFTERLLRASMIEIKPSLVTGVSLALGVRSVPVLSGTLTPSAGILASMNGEPLIVESHSGAGRIGTVLADGLWRACMSPEESSAAVRRLWAALAHRLVSGGDVPPGAAASLALDRTRCAPGDPVKVIVRTRDGRVNLAGARLRVTKPDGSTEELALSGEAGGAPGKWTAVIIPALQGEYPLRLELPGSSDGAPGSTLESTLSVRVRDVEMRDTTPRRADAEAIASATAGRVWPIDALDEFVDLLKRETIAREGTPRFEPMWDSPWVFVLIVSLLSAEWWWRRKGGLP